MCFICFLNIESCNLALSIEHFLLKQIDKLTKVELSTTHDYNYMHAKFSTIFILLYNYYNYNITFIIFLCQWLQNVYAFYICSWDIVFYNFQWTSSFERGWLVNWIVNIIKKRSHYHACEIQQILYPLYNYHYYIFNILLSVSAKYKFINFTFNKTIEGYTDNKTAWGVPN